MTQQEARPTELIYLVARDQQKLYAYLVKAFANENVKVILDRRVAERRRRSGPVADDRREGDRRRRPDIDERLRTLGWATITPGD